MILGLGSNQGDPVAHLAGALVRLAGRGTLVGLSSLYRTEPVGFAHQPDFLNMVALLRTTLRPQEMLALARDIEEAAGRERKRPNGPRTLDVDILFHGARVVDTPELQVPHPRWRERAFVLAPLVEVAPGWRDPVSGCTVDEAWAAWRGSERAPERVGGPDGLLGVMR